MSKTLKRNFRLQEETVAILQEVSQQTDTNESRIADMAIACYAMELGDADGRAKQFFMDMMYSRIAAHRMHAPRLPVMHGKGRIPNAK